MPGLSAMTLSATMTAVAATEQTPSYVATQENTWTVGGSALFVQPSTSQNLTYATVQTTNMSNGNTNNDNKSIDREYE